MNESAISDERHQAETGDSEAHLDLRHLIDHAAHLLPAQGPITVFVHHNTLHAFGHLPFDEAVKEGAAAYGCHPYQTEEFYRRELGRGRITRDDLSEVLIDDLGDYADIFIGFMGTRYHLRLAMLEHPLRLGTDAELRWLIADTDALHRFRDEVPPAARSRMIEQTRQWITRDYAGGQAPGRPKDAVSTLLERFDASRIDRWTDRTWESFTLSLLWRVCHGGVHGVTRFAEAPAMPIRHRDLMLMATGRDTDLQVHELLIRFCAGFVDQGFATWTLPDREAGFFRSFATLFRGSRPVACWLQALPAELDRIERLGLNALDSIEESLRLLGVSESERGDYIERTLLALRGWAGMLHQMETNAEWTAHPAPPGTLDEYLAVRLILERIALDHAAREVLPDAVDLSDLRSSLLSRIPHPPRVSVDQRAYLIFQLAQVRGWTPGDLFRLSKPQWSHLIEEVESFGGLERRRIYHLAYERHYRTQALDALTNHGERLATLEPPASDTPPSFQFVSCIDEREESFRRHLEEVAPSCQTFGIAGFFGVAMYYRGVAEANYRPLCPINIKPRHFVQEEPTHSFEDAGRLQASARRWIGRASHRYHLGSRSFLGGLLTGLMGSVATIPLVMRVLLPRHTAMFRRVVGSFVTPPVTQLRILRADPEPSPDDRGLGYSRAEMAGIVGGTLRAMGLTGPFAPIVIIAGHGSSSLNNPLKAAYDCGACGGARGGPNARAFAQMANDPRVRLILSNSGLDIPDDVVFVGAFHNTCNDGMTYFDLDRLPSTHREAFATARAAVEIARRRNAHERCRRFESAPTTISADEALRHVEARAEDLSQTRPELGHATNAICFVGRRDRTRGLFLDRRTFLTSYDPTRDDAEHSVLTSLLRAVIPVCAGINLEYFFSAVDPIGYGCGTKLPHNITSLLGIMDGAASDLRTGLPLQMIEIHEPMRCLFVIETTRDAISKIIAENPLIAEHFQNAWVQLALLDPRSKQMDLYRHGSFEPYVSSTRDLPTAPTSLDWYQGRRNHLGFATITAEGEAAGS